MVPIHVSHEILKIHLMGLPMQTMLLFCKFLVDILKWTPDRNPNLITIMDSPITSEFQRQYYEDVFNRDQIYKCCISFLCNDKDVSLSAFNC